MVRESLEGRASLHGRESLEWSGDSKMIGRVAKMVGRLWMGGCVGWSGESAALVGSLENRGMVG